MEEFTYIATCETEDVIQVGDDIILRVTAVKPSQAKFGVSAPEDLAIVRLEALKQEPFEQ